MILSREIGVPKAVGGGLVRGPSRSAAICLDLVVVVLLGTESTLCLLLMVLVIPLIEPLDFLFPLHFFMFACYF